MKPMFVRFLKNPFLAISYILCWYCPWLIQNDKLYLKVVYFCRFKKRLNLKNPKNFSEKLQWLKLYDRKPLYTVMADKIRVKEYVAGIIGDEYIIPTIGVWNSPNEIDFDILPNQFVLKCNHNSGVGMLICKNKDKLARKAWNKELKELKRGLKQDFFYAAREWPYKDIPKQILAESYIEASKGIDLRDYKFFCFNGKVKFLKVDFDRFIDHHANYYDTSWQILPFGEVMYKPQFDKIIAKPKNFDIMIGLAEKLSKDIPFARVDFYNVEGKIYFGEITFFPAGGVGEFTEPYADELLGSYLNLPILKN